MFIVDCYNIVSYVKDVVLIEVVTDMQVLIINATGSSTETSSINRIKWRCVSSGRRQLTANQMRFILHIGSNPINALTKLLININLY